MLQLAEEIVLFDKSKHQRDSCDCGNDVLNVYLKQHLSQNLKQNLIQAYVALEKNSNRILGYYTLSSASISHSELPTEMAKKLPKYPIPAILISRLACDKVTREAQLKLGSKLVIHALKQALKAVEIMGVMCVIVDAKPEAVAFYQKFGFQFLAESENRLYLPMNTIANLFAVESF
jgi:ribosomal protein S18 acetylase RimI-like enzyme